MLVEDIKERIALCFSNGGRGQMSGELGTFKTEALGTMSLPTGRLIPFNPAVLEWTDADALSDSCFKQMFPSGSHQVELSLFCPDNKGLSEVVVLSRIKFSSHPVESVRSASFANQDESDEKVLGFSSSTGVAVYGDASCYQKFIDEEKNGVDWSQPFYDRMEQSYLGGQVTLHGFNFVVFPTGAGDGSYGSVICYDGALNPVSLISDFGFEETSLLIPG